MNYLMQHQKKKKKIDNAFTCDMIHYSTNEIYFTKDFLMPFTHTSLLWNYCYPLVFSLFIFYELLSYYCFFKFITYMYKCTEQKST